MKTLLILLILLNTSFLKLPTEKTYSKLPYDIPDFKPAPLRSLLDEELQENLVLMLSSNKLWAKLIKNSKMAVGVVDISDPLNVKFGRVNGNEMMYAASLPKLGILLAAMDAIEKGEMRESEEIKRDMNKMIRISDNNAATRLIDKLGFEKIESVLTDPKYEFYDEEYGGGLWVGKRYAKSGNRYPDPIKGLSHAATVSQVCRYYYLLSFGKLVSFKRSKQMLDILLDPHLHHKFVNSIEKIAPNAKIFRKSGTWKNWHSDSMIVWGKNWRKYILVALVEDPKGETILRNLVYKIEELLNKDVGKNVDTN
jgi:beta-lactamase class A